MMYVKDILWNWFPVFTAIQYGLDQSSRTRLAEQMIVEKCIN